MSSEVKKEKKGKPLSKLQALLAAKKKEASRIPFVDDSLDAVLGPADAGKSRVETATRRASETIGSSEWWLETLSIDDGSGAKGQTSSSWELNVYFDPHAPGSTRLVDFEGGDEDEAAALKREEARVRYKQRHFSDDLYGGRGTVPLGLSGPYKPPVAHFNTAHEADCHAATDGRGPRRFAPEDVLADTPTIEQLRRKERKERKRLGKLLQQRGSGVGGSLADGDSRGMSMTSASSRTSSAYSRASFSTDGSSFTDDDDRSETSSNASSFRSSIRKSGKGAGAARKMSGGGGSFDAANSDPKLREAFKKYSRNGTTVKLANLDKICNGALELGLTKTQIDGMLDHVETDGSGEMDFATFSAMMLPYSDAAY